MSVTAGIPDIWILLDRESTVDVFMNKKLLKNIHHAKTALSLHCNTGVTTRTRQGIFQDMAQSGFMRIVLLTYYHSTI